MGCKGRKGELQDEDVVMAEYESDCSDDEDSAVGIDLRVDTNSANV